MSNSSRKITVMITSQRSFASSSFDLRTKTPVERLFPVAWSEQNMCRMGFILVVAEDKTISQHFKKIHLVKSQEKKHGTLPKGNWLQSFL